RPCGDARWGGCGGAGVGGVIEHLDPPRLSAFARVLFGCARPRAVVLTTPNREYNARFEGLPAGKFRHADHRFEWTRSEFAAWCAGVCSQYGYAVRLAQLGDENLALGGPSQMGVVTRC